MIFISLPDIDLNVSALFFQNNSFYLKENALVHGIYQHTQTAVVIISVSLILALIYTFFTKKTILNLRANAFAFLLLAMCFASGLVVNAFIKSYSERARPRAVLQFGGEKNFAPIFSLSGQCQTNCSFVSGHASAGFIFVALAFLPFSLTWKVCYFLIGLVLGALIGLVRIIQGGHFLSDVIFSFYFTYLGVVLVYLAFRFFNPLKAES